MNKQFDNLTEEELREIAEKYGLKVGKAKNPNEPSFQVVRGHAIRCGTKYIANKTNNVQKNVKLLDTHKIDDVDGIRKYVLILQVDNINYEVHVAVDIMKLEAKVIDTKVTQEKHL